MRLSRITRMWPAFALAAVLVLAAMLRILPLDQRDYWYDEAFTGITVRQPWGEMMHIVIGDVHPPFYYAALKVWAFVVGSGPVALRMFSVTLGVATVWLIFVAVRKLVPKTPLPALAAALVAAINPFFVNYSQEARMYSLLGFLLLLAAVFLLQSWERPRAKTRVAYGAVLLLSVLTHNLAFLFVAVFVVADVWNLARTRSMSFVSWFLSAYALPIVGFAVWLPFFLLQMSTHEVLGWVPEAPFSALLTTLHIFLFGAPVGVAGVPPPLGFRVSWLTVPAMSVALLAGSAFLVAGVTRKKAWSGALVLVSCLAVLPVVMTWLLQLDDMRLYVERYMFGAAIFLVVFLVAALGRLSTKILVPAVALYALAVVLVQPFTHVRVFPDILTAVEPEVVDHIIVFTDAFSFTVGRYYLGEEYLPHVRLYHVEDATWSLEDWATVGEGQQLFTLPTEPYVVVTSHPEAFPGYRVLAESHTYTVMER